MYFVSLLLHLIVFSVLKRTNYTKWSDIVVVRLPNLEPSSITFEKKLSINVWDLGVTREGEVMYGNKKFVSHFKISILKSPINIMLLFSKGRFSIRFF